MNALPLRSGTRQGCPFSLLVFNIVLEGLANAKREEKEMRPPHLKGRNKAVFVYAQDDDLCRTCQRINIKAFRANTKFIRVAG